MVCRGCRLTLVGPETVKTTIRERGKMWSAAEEQAAIEFEKTQATFILGPLSFQQRKKILCTISFSP